VAHCLLGSAHTAAATSSSVTGRKPKNTLSVDVNGGTAALEVDARMSATFLSKKLWKSLALRSHLTVDLAVGLIVLGLFRPH